VRPIPARRGRGRKTREAFLIPGVGGRVMWDFHEELMVEVLLSDLW
jgi:hypothetical protein